MTSFFTPTTPLRCEGHGSATLKRDGFTTGGLNFAAKIRRQSIDPDDLLRAHAASMDACAFLGA